VRPRGDTEEIVAKEGREQIREAAEIEGRRREPTGPQPGVAVAVVELTRLRLREHFVGLDHLAESLLGVRLAGDVRMEGPRQPAKRLLDLGLARRAPDSEDFVVVAVRRRHRSRSVAS
jgi:hypothetical protein